MSDYTRLLDAETRAFVERTNSFYPPESIEFTAEQQRRVYDRMCEAFHAGSPKGVRAHPAAIPLADRTIPIRLYRKDGGEADTVSLYFHGGGFVLGGLESHDDICAEICAETGHEMISVDYRLAPEHRHPAQFEDALAAFRWAAARDGRPILLMGDSAGGNLAAAVAHATRDDPHRPVAQVLIYPGLGGDRRTGSYVTHAQAPMLSTRDVAFYDQIRCEGQVPEADPTYAPLSDNDFSRLPPTFIVTAECDPLSSDGEAYRDRILRAGGKAAWIEEAGLVHGYLRGRHCVAKAARSFARIVDAARALGQGRWIEAAR